MDESYLRKAILNPSATVAVGFLPIMPTFVGQLTEEELQALIVYLKSLSVRFRFNPSRLRGHVTRWSESPRLSDRCV